MRIKTHFWNTVESERRYLSADRKVVGLPLDRNAHAVMVKPGELVDVIEISPLGLVELRIYNQLIANAWSQITEPVEHRIRKADLKGSHGSSDRINDSVNRLMGAVAFASVMKDGEPAKLKVQLLGANIEQDRADGYFYYRFPPELLEVFKKSEVFARLKTRIMYAFQSKYALRLYEVVQKRVNLKYKQFEDFTESEMRGLLGVPKGKLKRFADLNKHAIKPAVEEVNFLGDYMVMVQPIKAGRKVAKLRLVWLEKDRDSLMEAWRELDRAKVGRKARMKGTVEEAN